MNDEATGGVNYDHDYGALYYHMDMDDVCWTPVILENKRLIGWLGPDMGDDPLGIWN